MCQVLQAAPSCNDTVMGVLRHCAAAKQQIQSSCLLPAAASSSYREPLSTSTSHVLLAIAQSISNLPSGRLRVGPSFLLPGLSHILKTGCWPQHCVGLDPSCAPPWALLNKKAYRCHALIGPSLSTSPIKYTKLLLISASAEGHV